MNPIFNSTVRLLLWLLALGCAERWPKFNFGSSAEEKSLSLFGHTSCPKFNLWHLKRFRTCRICPPLFFFVSTSFEAIHFRTASHKASHWPTLEKTCGIAESPNTSELVCVCVCVLLIQSLIILAAPQKKKKKNQSGPHTAWRKWTCEKPRWLFWSPLFAIFTSPITSLGKPPVQICKLLSGCEDSFPSTRERQDRQRRGLSLVWLRPSWTLFWMSYWSSRMSLPLPLPEICRFPFQNATTQVPSAQGDSSQMACAGNISVLCGRL